MAPLPSLDYTSFFPHLKHTFKQHRNSSTVTPATQANTTTSTATTFMHTIAPTNTTNITSSTTNAMTKMLSFFRKSKTSVMANPNTSETTLVSAPSTTGKGKQSRKPKYETEPYAAEFTGLSTLGGMPSLGGHFFAEPPVKAKKSKAQVEPKLVPTQPFKGSPRASFVQDRLSTVQGMFQTPSPAISNTCTTKGKPEMSAGELLEAMYSPSALMIGGVVAPFRLQKNEKKVQ
ncbi:uncharacterized protein UTRI_01022_B [Ustilago trichophora]|uniref:Uncharacterized protein n=1 Tax=Ustilago trichophora TaxID=86804 RepID=A0A5C3DT77_9BASI|nr:uncharacterized protein UTRI_01022_B [Ustilago trichophora]